MSVSPSAGLHLDQAPPLGVPASFFLTAPCAVVAAGALLAVGGEGVLTTRWSLQTVALAHLGTLGLLGTAMLGALYQLVPVVAGVPVPAIRLARWVHGAWTLGVTGLIAGLLGPHPHVLHGGVFLLLASLLAFVVPVGIALARAPSRHESVAGMRVALGSLVLVAGLGLAMAHGFAGFPFPGPRPLWSQVHLGIGLMGWVGGMIAAVSWQVLPMFYLAAPFDPRGTRATRWAILAGVLLPMGVLAMEKAGLTGSGWGSAERLAALAALPAAVAVWALHPLGCRRSLAGRRRRRADASLGGWKAGLIVAPALLPLGAAGVLLADPRWGLLFGWLAIWGWAGAILHGMLTRVVPFLVWFHRFAPHLATRQPSMRDLFPDERVGWVLRLHSASVASGALAIILGGDVLPRFTGLLLVALGIVLLHALAATLLRRPVPLPSSRVP